MCSVFLISGALVWSIFWIVAHSSHIKDTERQRDGQNDSTKFVNFPASRWKDQPKKQKVAHCYLMN